MKYVSALESREWNSLRYPTPWLFQYVINYSLIKVAIHDHRLKTHQGIWACHPHFGLTVTFPLRFLGGRGEVSPYNEDLNLVIFYLKKMSISCGTIKCLQYSVLPVSITVTMYKITGNKPEKYCLSLLSSERLSDRPNAAQLHKICAEIQVCLHWSFYCIILAICTYHLGGNHQIILDMEVAFFYNPTRKENLQNISLMVLSIFFCT